MSNKNTIQQRSSILRGIFQKRQHYWHSLWALRPRSAKTMDQYSGVNWGILAHHICERPGFHPIFATFNAIKNMDFKPPSEDYVFTDPAQILKCIQTSKEPLNHVRRGENGAKILFFKYDDTQEDPARQNSFSWTTVFSISQCEGEGVERFKRAWESYQQSKVTGTWAEFLKQLTLFAKTCRLSSSLAQPNSKNASVIISENQLPQPTVDTTHEMNMANLGTNVVNLDYNIYELDNPTIYQCINHIRMMVYAQLQVYGENFHLWEDQYDETQREPLPNKKQRKVKLHCAIILYQIMCALASSCGIELNQQFFDLHLFTVERQGVRQMDKMSQRDFNNLAQDAEVWKMVKRTFAVTNSLVLGYNRHQSHCRKYTIFGLYDNPETNAFLFVEGTHQLIAPEIFNAVLETSYPFITAPKLC
uniref:Antirestriction protein ArdC n=1 Tax=Clandestinovirus TaxID=2831644 RepID=A0A8F8KRS8_9VIRU|nr:antirestriction protein ArdC [Clandestinovirus]